MNLGRFSNSNMNQSQSYLNENSSSKNVYSMRHPNQMGQHLPLPTPPQQLHPHNLQQHHVYSQQMPFINTNNNLNQIRQLDQSYQSKSLLGPPPDQLLNSLMQYQMPSHLIATNSSSSGSSPVLASQNNYHQHQPTLITLANGNSNMNLLNNINNSNAQCLGARLTNSSVNINNNYSNQTNSSQNNRNIATNNNFSNKTRPRFAKESYHDSTSNKGSTYSETSTSAYKQKLKTSIDANKRNINQNVNSNTVKYSNNSPNTLNTNQFPLKNSSNPTLLSQRRFDDRFEENERFDDIEPMPQYQNKQLIVIKPADDVFEEKKESNQSALLQPKDCTISNKRSHSDKEPILIDDKNVKKQNTNAAITDILSDNRSIVKLHGCLMEKINHSGNNEKETNRVKEDLLLKVQLEVYYCKFCCLILNDEECVAEHLKKLEHTNKTAKLSVSNN